MNTHITDESVAVEILRRTGVNLVEAAMVAKAAIEAGRGRVKRAMKCIEEGERELRRQEKTVTFARAVEVALEARNGRRARTQSDFRYITRCFMKRCRGLSNRRVRSISCEECERYINAAFGTPSQRAKARRILSGVFSTACKRGWCSDNPVRKVEVPRVQEKRIRPLTRGEIQQLMTTAKEYENGKCMAAVGIMLYAGVRPHEVARLSWGDIDMNNRSINIMPLHSKTGGSRRVTLQPPLVRLLRSCPVQRGRICPAQWLRHWRLLHRQAGWGGNKPWQPDVLRHTFAGYHLLHFKNYEELQFEMGHRDSSLLRTRYVDLTTVENTALFWQ